MQTVIELSNGVLEVSKEIGIPQQYSVSEIQEPEKRSGNYSKSVVLPGTKNNNKLLGNLFDVNEDFTFFNPNIKTPAKVVTDSTVTLDGYLQLVSITKLNNSDLSGNQIQYNVTIFEKSVDFFTAIGDKLLSELDFSDYDHTLDHPTITATWAGGRTSEDVYAYPLLYKNSSNYETTDFKPAIYHKAYLEAIAKDAGFNLSGTFLDDPVYNKEIIPSAVSGDVFLTDDEIIRRKFQAGVGVSAYTLYSDTLLGGLVNANGATFVQPLTVFDAFTDDSTAPNFDPNNHYNTTTDTYTPDTTGSYNLVFDAFFDAEFTTASTEAWQSTYNVGTFPVAQETNQTLNNDFRYKVRAYVYVNGVQEGTAYTSGYITAPKATGTNSTFNAGNSYQVNQEFGLQFVVNNIKLIAGDDVTIRYQVENALSATFLNYKDNINPTLGTPVSVSLDMKVDPSRGGVDSKLANEPNGGQITDGDPVSLNNYINPKAKQKDILIDILKRYNVHIYPGTNNSREIVIDTRNEYYNKGSVLDWTNKKDYSRQDEIKLISELQSKELLFTYSEGDDTFNEQYTENVNGDIYGQKTVSFTNEFTKGTKEIETPFAPTPLVYSDINKTMVVSALGTATSYEELRVLYFDGVKDTIGGASWTFDWINGSTPTTTTYTTYPYAGHYDDPYTPVYDINFGQLPYTWYSELEQTTDLNLYNRHWSSYVNQMTEGKLVTSYFYLTEVDISFIKDNLNSKIWVRDSYFYINAIRDYNPIKTGLTKVELLKIVDGVAYTGETTEKEEIRTPYENSSVLRTAPPEDVTTNTVDSTDVLVTGNNNRIGFNSEGSIITGANNSIGDNNTNTSIIGGSGNTIDSDVSNSFIIGANNKTISQDNETWIGDLNVVDGVIQSLADVDLTIKSAKVTLSAANLLSGSAVDVPGADAPGAGYALSVLDFVVYYNHNSVVYNVGQYIEVKTDTATTYQLKTPNILGVASDTFVKSRPDNAGSISLVENKKLTVKSNAASGLGDGDAIAYVTYRIVEL